MLRRIERAERRVSGPEACARCGGRHLPDLVSVVLYARAVDAGQVADGPACTCACCPDWGGLAAEAVGYGA